MNQENWTDKADRELIEYWRMSIGFAVTRHDRLQWASKAYSKRHSIINIPAVYKRMDHLTQISR